MKRTLLKYPFKGRWENKTWWVRGGSSSWEGQRWGEVQDEALGQGSLCLDLGSRVWPCFRASLKMSSRQGWGGSKEALVPGLDGAQLSLDSVLPLTGRMTLGEVWLPPL